MKKMMKERTKCMELIEMMVVMGKNRMIQLPEEEVKVMGLKEGDELCLSYLVDDWMEGKVNEAGEFLVESLPLQCAMGQRRHCSTRNIRGW